MNFDYTYRYLSGSKISMNAAGFGYVASNSIRLVDGPQISKQGSSNEGYQDKIAQGVFVGSNYFRSFCDGSAVLRMSSAWQQWGVGKYESHSCDVESYVTSFPLLPDIRQQTVDQALLNYYSKLRSLLASWEVLATTAEFRSSISGIVSRYKAMRLYIKRGTLRALYKSSRIIKGPGSRRLKRESISGLWLEFHLGLKPLVMDFEDAATSFVDRSRPYLIHVVGKKAISYHQPRDSGYVTPNNWDRAYYTLDHEIKEFYRVQGFYDIEVLNQYSRQGFDPTGAVMALWEVVPLSFVIDYFAQVDKFLLSNLMCGLKPTAAVITSGVTRKSKYKVTHFEVHRPSVPGDCRAPVGYIVPSESTLTYGYVNRSVDPVGGIGLPSSIVYRGWNELHWSQQLTCGALLTQASKRLRKLTWFL